MHLSNPKAVGLSVACLVKAHACHVFYNRRIINEEPFFLFWKGDEGFLPLMVVLKVYLPFVGICIIIIILFRLEGPFAGHYTRGGIVQKHFRK